MRTRMGASEDGFGEIINDPMTFKDIAYDLRDYHSAIVGWTDGQDTHYDILFTYRAERKGVLQGGINGNYLFVSIMRVGAFGFDAYETETSPDYYGEKLFITNKHTQEKLAELINGVKKVLTK